jgi:hypothetical protein
LKKILLAAVILAASPTTHAQALDYAQFKSSVEPIFLKKRPGHVRCVVCHGERSGSSFKLEKFAAGQKGWSEEQSRRNFEMVSRLVVPGKPESSLLLMYPLAPEAGGGAYHSGGRQFENRDDPDWKAMARWASGG